MRGHDGPSDTEMPDSSTLEFFDKDRRWGGSKLLLLFRGWGVEERAVFSHDPLAKGDLGKDFEQLREHASGDQDQLAAGCHQSFQSLNDAFINPPVMSECSIIVRG